MRLHCLSIVKIIPFRTFDGASFWVKNAKKIRFLAFERFDKNALILPKLQTITDLKLRFSSSPTKPLTHNDTLMAQKDEPVHDQLADSLNDLFTSVSTMIKSQLQGTNNELEVLEKMNERVSEEYKGMGGVASGLRVFVEQLKSKGGNFDQYVQQIDAIEQQVTEFEAVVSMLDKHVSLLESKVLSVYPNPPHPTS